MYPPHGAGPLTMRLRASPSTSDHTTAIPEDPSSCGCGSDRASSGATREQRATSLDDRPVKATGCPLKLMVVLESLGDGRACNATVREEVRDEQCL